MRGIKFRAWDSVMNEMFYDSELSNGDLLVIHMDGRLELSDDDTYKVSDFEIMQFTGLKDKNGKEIFEWDIVKVLIYSCPIERAGGGHEYKANYWMGKVQYADGCFEIQFDATRDYLKCYTCNHAVEVIGNIYECGNES